MRKFYEESFNGFFTEVGDECDLANRIIFWVKNDGICKNIGEMLKESDTFSWAKIAREFDILYKKSMWVIILTLNYDGTYYK
ncbi:MAG: hypothetical protein O8C66_06815 [Candidatus Methanoperedens sp.]|nr:hypothetical protein [Candidatus Methanoperedens sp.]